MEVIFLGFWISIIAFGLGAMWLFGKWAYGAITRKKEEKRVPSSPLPWTVAMLLLGLAVIFFVVVAASFSRGFWK